MAFLDIVSDRSGVFQIRGNVGTVAAAVSPENASRQARGNIGTLQDIAAEEGALKVLRGTLAGVAGVVSSAFVLLTRPGGGLVKVWGGAWTEKPVKVWMGSSWEAKPLKVWSGTQWDLS